MTDDRLYLTDIAERIERIQTYTQGRLLGSGTYWIHDYLGIDVNEVWKAVERHLPNFKTKSNEILRELTTDA